MGKRSDFKKRANDKYCTPEKPILDLLKRDRVKPHNGYIEPFAGKNRMVNVLNDNGFECKGAYDIAPMAEGIDTLDALDLTTEHLRGASYIISNPPWTRELLHPILTHFITLPVSTWLLFDADWMHTTQNKAAKATGSMNTPQLLEYCTEIISIGRVSWMENGTSGKDNCCWYNFCPFKSGFPLFKGRA